MKNKLQDSYENVVFIYISKRVAISIKCKQNSKAHIAVITNEEHIIMIVQSSKNFLLYFATRSQK